MTPSSASTYQSVVLLAPSNFSHSHNHNLWEWNILHCMLPGPCLIFSWCWDFIVWVFFFFLLPCLKRKSKDWQGWKGGLFLKHLPWSTWLPRAEVMCWVLRGRLLPEVSALCCMTHRVGAFRYIKDSIKITIAVLYCSPITGVCSRYRTTSLNILYQFYLVKSNLESNPIWLYSVSAMLFDLIISSLHWITSPVLFPVCALPFLPCEYDSVSRHLLLCSCCSKIQDFVSVLPSFWHSGSRCNIF